MLAGRSPPRVVKWGLGWHLSETPGRNNARLYTLPGHRVDIEQLHGELESEGFAYDETTAKWSATQQTPRKPAAQGSQLCNAASGANAKDATDGDKEDENDEAPMQQTEDVADAEVTEDQQEEREEALVEQAEVAAEAKANEDEHEDKKEEIKVEDETEEAPMQQTEDAADIGLSYILKGRFDVTMRIVHGKVRYFSQTSPEVREKLRIRLEKKQAKAALRVMNAKRKNAKRRQANGEKTQSIRRDRKTQPIRRDGFGGERALATRGFNLNRSGGLALAKRARKLALDIEELFDPEGAPSVLIEEGLAL